MTSKTTSDFEAALKAAIEEDRQILYCTDEYGEGHADGLNKGARWAAKWKDEHPPRCPEHHVIREACGHCAKENARSQTLAAVEKLIDDAIKELQPNACTTLAGSRIDELERLKRKLQALRAKNREMR